MVVLGPPQDEPSGTGGTAGTTVLATRAAGWDWWVGQAGGGSRGSAGQGLPTQASAYILPGLASWSVCTSLCPFHTPLAQKRLQPLSCTSVRVTSVPGPLCCDVEGLFRVTKHWEVIRVVVLSWGWSPHTPLRVALEWALSHRFAVDLVMLWQCSGLQRNPRSWKAAAPVVCCPVDLRRHPQGVSRF